MTEQNNLANPVSDYPDVRPIRTAFCVNVTVHLLHLRTQSFLFAIVFLLEDFLFVLE